MTIPADRLNQIVHRFAEIEARLASGTLEGEAFVAASRDYAELEPVARTAEEVRSMRAEIESLSAMLADPEMKAMAEDELAHLHEALPEKERALAIAMLPRDSADMRPAMLEIRAGTGGDEAALFAADLYRMYERFAAEQGWRVEPVSVNASDIGGYKEVVANIAGNGVFAKLKFESGVHRVQRVPETESGGRIHTSAATVAVLPEPDEVDVRIDDKDLKIDVYRASGAGGQHVNTTDSAVRITHLPTGTVVTCQDGRSQHKNKDKAMQVLRARLFEAQRDAAQGVEAEARKAMVGSGDRSERIRTYNFPQGRVTDHRIGLTLHKLPEILAGPGLGELVDALIAEDEAKRLAALEFVTVAEALREAAARLGTDWARDEAEMLMAHALGTTRSAMLLGHMRDPVPAGFEAMIQRRLTDEPLAYITGEAEFYGRTFKVTPDVLIPRGDSEAVLEAALDAAPGATRILDCGVGSGCLLLSLLAERPNATGIGVDRAEPALAVAAANAAALGLGDRATLLARDWNQPGWAARLDTFDLVIANPPYVEDDAELDASVRDFEPPGALFAGPEGLDDYRVLIPQLPALLTPGGVAVLEIGYRQAEAVGAIAEEAGFAAALRRDLAGRPRALILSRKSLAKSA